MNSNFWKRQREIMVRDFARSLPFILGCVAALVQSGCAAQIDQPVVYDAGVVSKDIVYDCVVGGSGAKTVEAVTRSCGCAMVGLEKGDVLTLSKPFKVAVSVRGKAPGKGSTDISVTFTDSSVFGAKLVYDYFPPPSVTPEYLIFKASDDAKGVALSFHGETGVKLVDVVLPDNIRLADDLVAQKKDGELLVQFKVDRSVVSQSQDGMIDIMTSSRRQPKFRIPYLILENK